MNIYKYNPGTELPLAPSVIALGVFDGVHIGHRALLSTARRLADELGVELTVFTFPSERSAFKNAAPLYTTEDKLGLFELLGADNAVLADFESIADVSAEDFIKKCLLCDMRCRGAVAGYDFRFGHGRGGDAELLKTVLASFGAVCKIEDEVRLGGEKVSSTRIRELLLRGDAEGAAELLGLPYFITSEVRHGRGVGRELGFPTVNTVYDGFTPPLKRGVYRTVCRVGGELYNSITNVGVCPTFGQRDLHAETHLIDFSGDLYGERVCTYFLGYLRDEVHFETEKELIMQIKVDKNETIKRNGEKTWQEIGLS